VTAVPGPIHVVGAGRAGTGLACSLRDAGFPVELVVRRAPARELPVPCRELESLVLAPDRPAVLLLAVPDRSIPEVAERLLRRAPPSSRLVIGHLSGVLPSSHLVPGERVPLAGRFSAHPLFAFPPPVPALPLPARVPFLVEGDTTGTSIAQALVLAMEGTPIPIEPDRKPLAHGAAVLAANLPAELVFTAADVFRDLGVPEPEQVAAQLFRSLADNLEALPSPSSLTGPLTRGDSGTIAANLASLAQWSGGKHEVPSLYRRLSLRLALRLRQCGSYRDPALWKRLREVLK